LLLISFIAFFQGKWNFHSGKLGHTGKEQYVETRDRFVEFTLSVTEGLAITTKEGMNNLT